MPIDAGEESAPFEFDFSISFAGPERAIAQQLAEALTERGALVFYDASYRGRLVGKRLDQEFAWIFGRGTRYVIPIVSHSYVQRSWPQLEWDIAMREADSREKEFVLPVRCDDALLVGLPGSIGYLDTRELTIDEVADVLIKKLSGVEVVQSPPREWVATFGVLIDEAYEHGLPAEAPRDYPHLCDWLEHQLLRSLETAPLVNPRKVEDKRDGETASVRIAFEWGPEMGPLKFGAIAPWDVLEVLPHDAVYPQ